MRKGQLVVFVAVGFFLVIIVFLLFAMMKFTGEKIVVEDTNDITTFTQSCLEKTTKDGLIYLGLVGGNIKPSVFTNVIEMDFDDYGIPYYYFKGVVYYTGAAQLEGILKKYVEDNVAACLNKYKQFPAYQVSDTVFTATVKIQDSDVEVRLYYPASLTKGKSVLHFERFVVSVPLRMKEISQVAGVITDGLKSDVESIPWDYFTTLGERQFNMTVYTVGKDTLVYRIVDEKNVVGNEPYIFQFAARIER